MKVFNSNFFLSAMHGFRDNKVLSQIEYDVNVSPPLEGVSHSF